MDQGTFARSGWATMEPANHIYLPLATDRDADLALALYREGLSVNSVPFGYLSLFKILNIRLSSGADQERWINDHLKDISYGPASDRFREIEKLHENVGNYMYVQGRCAIAHANSNPLVNPDTYTDRRRMKADFPLMKELAALYIEKELGVASDSSFYKHFDQAKNRSELLIRGSVKDGWITYAPYSPDA